MDEYINTYSGDAKQRLQQIRKTIQELSPTSSETISYGMPTFKLYGRNLIHFAAFKNHIGIYPTPSAVTYFEPFLSQYAHAKGSIQFPLDKPFPYDLLEKIVKFRIKEVTDGKPLRP